MEKINNSETISQDIESGKYFSEALEWYCDRYLTCVTERAWLCIISTFLAVFVVCFAVNIYFLFPIKTDFTLIKYTDRHADEFSTIRKLNADRKENEQVSVSRYLVAKYVQEYESYSYDDLTSQFNFIKNNSSRRVYLSFSNFMSPENRNSPIVKYRKDITRQVIVSDIQLSINTNVVSSVDSAIVTYYIKEINKGVSSTLPPRIVSLKFSLSNVKMNAAGVMPLEFSVTDYSYLQS